MCPNVVQCRKGFALVDAPSGLSAQGEKERKSTVMAYPVEGGRKPPAFAVAHRPKGVTSALSTLTISHFMSKHPVSRHLMGVHLMAGIS